MDDRNFNALADAALTRIEEMLEAVESGLDFEMLAGGIIEIEFDDGSKMVVNRHSVAREIWVAARSGGFHFRHDGERWLDTRDGEELFAKLNRLIGEQSGGKILLR